MDELDNKLFLVIHEKFLQLYGYMYAKLSPNAELDLSGHDAKVIDDVTNLAIKQIRQAVASELPEEKKDTSVIRTNWSFYVEGFNEAILFMRKKLIGGE